MIARETSWRPDPAAVLALLLLVLCWAGGCGSGGGQEEEFVPELPRVVEPPPEDPVPADSGLPGSWIPVTELDPVGRMFVVSGGQDAPPESGLVMVPGRWGVQRELRDLARQLATENLLVAIPDLYDGVVPQMAVSVPELQAGVSKERALKQIGAALEHCAADPDLPEQAPLLLFATGGGGPLAFEHALEPRLPVSGMVLDTPAPLPAVDEPVNPLDIPVLVLYGTVDAAFDEARIARLEGKLERAGAQVELESISGAGSELFDERAMGFSNAAMKVALEELLAFVENRAGR